MNAAAAAVLLVLALVALNQARAGTLGMWLRAKFLGSGDPLRLPTVEQPPSGGPVTQPSTHGGWTRPMPAPTISPFGAPRDGGRRRHQGIDIGGDGWKGQPVGAARPGRVAAVRGDGKCGLRVWIDHGDGWRTLYCHLDAIWVNPGEVVESGQPVGSCGNTGNARSTPPHVHFETRRDGTPVDPATLIPGHVGGGVQFAAVGVDSIGADADVMV